MATEKWTKTMQYCYDRNCVCVRCFQGGLITSQKRCFVKQAIMDYIRKYGVPDFVETKKTI